MDARGAGAADAGEVAGGDRAGAGVLGGVEVRHPLRDVVAQVVGHQLLGSAEVPLCITFVAEGRLHPPGLGFVAGVRQSRVVQGVPLVGMAAPSSVCWSDVPTRVDPALIRTRPETGVSGWYMASSRLRPSVVKATETTWLAASVA